MEEAAPVDEYISTRKRFNTYYKYVFFNHSLGLIFKVQDGKVVLTKIEGEGRQNRIEFEDIPIYRGDEGKVAPTPAKSYDKEEGDDDAEEVMEEFQNSTIILDSDEEQERLNDEMLKNFHETSLLEEANEHKTENDEAATAVSSDLILDTNKLETKPVTEISKEENEVDLISPHSQTTAEAKVFVL